MDNNKCPHKADDSFAYPNKNEDFVPLYDILKCKNLEHYKSLAVSIWANKICAIDIDHCFSKQNDLSSASLLALDIINRFKDFAYIEFSFSGTGLRFLFRQKDVPNYIDTYYIKNSLLGIEYYQPGCSARYVSVTGNCIIDNDIDNDKDYSKVIVDFLDKYMKRKMTFIEHSIIDIETRPFEELEKKTKHLYMSDYDFQTVWFSQAPGSGFDESERDYKLICLLFEKVTKDKESIRRLFEESPFFKSKDWKHKHKWEASEYRYFNYQYNEIVKRH